MVWTIIGCTYGAAKKKLKQAFLGLHFFASQLKGPGCGHERDWMLHGGRPEDLTPNANLVTKARNKSQLSGMVSWTCAQIAAQLSKLTAKTHRIKTAAWRLSPNGRGTGLPLFYISAVWCFALCGKCIVVRCHSWALPFVRFPWQWGRVACFTFSVDTSHC